jgi:hypothetical protein
MTEQEDEDTEKYGLPRLHRRDGIHRVCFAVNVSQINSPQNPGDKDIRFVSTGQRNILDKELLLGIASAA